MVPPDASGLPALVLAAASARHEGSGQQPKDQISGYIFFARAKLFLGDLYKVVRGHERLLDRDWVVEEDFRSEK